MAGVGLTYDLGAIERLQKRIDQIADFDRRALLDQIGGIAESQTRRRLEEDKRSPDGMPWEPLSPEYTKRKRGSGGILELEGELIDSIGYFIYLDGSAVEVGSNLIYAATHQMGDDRRGIPARPYLGLSDDDESELVELIDTYLVQVVLP